MGLPPAPCINLAITTTAALPLLLLQVLVNAQARCLDLATALVLDSSVMLLVSPAMKQPLLQRLDKYIFPADDVTVNDVSERCGMLTIMGPQADDVMQELAGVRVYKLSCRV
jgi:folate-binding Fe-S cluster repair protein YgfZ